MASTVLDYSQFIAPVTLERLRLIEELGPRFRSVVGRMRRLIEDRLVDLFHGNGAEEQIREHVGLRIKTRIHIENCDMERAVEWMANPPRDVLKNKDSYKNEPDERLPRFQRPPGDRGLRTSLFKFYEQNCKPRSCPFIVTWFAIDDLRAGASA